MANVLDTLASALARHGIELPADRVALLDRYCQVLWDWNNKLNLTRHTDYEKFVARDVADARQLEQLLGQGERVLDVGTGGGLPGIILVVLRPDLFVSLSESVAKKAAATTDIVRQLELKIPVYHARAEELLASEYYDTLIVRAVAPLSKLLTWFNPHWGAFGRLLIVKGPAWVDERGDARHRGLLSGLELRKRSSYPLPGTTSESVILEIHPKTDD